MAAMLVVALGAGILCTTQGQWSFLFRHESIQQLQQLPENSVAHLVGVVIYADEQGGQYWVEDKTGAVPIALNPGWPGIHVGDTIFDRSEEGCQHRFGKRWSRSQTWIAATITPIANGRW
jgi:hypothetical protein